MSSKYAMKQLFTTMGDFFTDTEFPPQESAGDSAWPADEPPPSPWEL